jgi:predicted RNA-binding Zn ribbon-like protein
MTAADRFERIGDNPSADFVNTVYSPEHPEGSLRSAKDVIDLLAATGVLAANEAPPLRRALVDRAGAQRFLARALQLRSAVTAAFEAIESKRALPDESLAILNASLEADAGFDRLERVRGARYDLTYHRLSTDPASALAPLARDTARLLAMPNAPIKKCAGEGCVRHFFDDSRTGRRRWCDMAICGNRAKAAAFAKRQRG